MIYKGPSAVLILIRHGKEEQIKAAEHRQLMNKLVTRTAPQQQQVTSLFISSLCISSCPLTCADSSGTKRKSKPGQLSTGS